MTKSKIAKKATMTKLQQKHPKSKIKKGKRVSFVKISLRNTPQVDKNTNERDYFKKLRDSHVKQSSARKHILDRFAAPSVLQCPKCKNNTVSFEAVIGRSQDEDLIKQCQCRTCDYRYCIR